MRCQHCRHENPPGGKFCGECGTRLEVRCPACSTANVAANDTCRTCGGPLTQELPGTRPVSERYTRQRLTETIFTSKAALEGERKQITVLFADMKGSMELIADRDPEEARKVLNPVLERMMESVHRYEGTVSEVLGDGIMALFGAPLAHEDHGIRACYAALRMQEAVKRYAQEIQRTHGVPIQIRVGLDSGEVVVCTIGNELRMDYTVVGQSAHLAARMEQAAMPGSTLITGSTLRLVEGYVQVKALGKIQIKGLSEAVEAYELTGAEPARTRLQAAASRGLTRFIGRNAELDRLRMAWQQAVAGHGQVVALVGEPGVGKSRLFYEFARSLPRDSWLIIESGSVSHGKATAYSPVIELLKNYFKIHDRDDHHAIREKVTTRLFALDQSLNSSTAALLALLDTPSGDTEWEKLDPQFRREKTLDAVKRLLLRESEVQPLLVVFEDLHVVDFETQAVLRGLAESLAPARILLIVTYRHEYERGWDSRPYYTELRIAPLEPDSARHLLDALLGDDAALQPFKQMLAERTGGNPLFLEESVRAFAELGALAGEPGAYRLTGSLTAIQVPSTVQPVIAARIDRLSPAHKQLLQAAAVIGTSVPFPLLHAIAELPDEALRQGLAHLQSAEFLHETDRFPEPEYRFKHALIHEVAYVSLLHERRRSLHAQIMRATENLYWDRLTEHIEHLSHHALRGEVWNKAVSYCHQAGAKAAAKSAHREAAARFIEALTAVDHLPQSDAVMKQAFDLRFSLRTSLSPLGEFRRSFELLSEAEVIATTLNDPTRLARVFTFKALYFWSIGQQDRAIDIAEEALTTAQRVGETPSQVLATLFAARARHARGDYEQAITLLNWVIGATDGDRANFLGMANLPSVSARTWLSWSLAERGMFGPAMVRGDEGVFIAEAVDHLVSRIYAYMALGIVHLRQGDFAEAIPTLQRAFQMSDRGDLLMARTMVAGYLGRAYTLSNRAADAIVILNQAVDTAASMELMVDQPIRLVHLSEAYLHTGQMEQAASIAHLALQSAEDYNQRGAGAWTHWLLGEIHSRAGSLETSEGHYGKAMAVASELGMDPLLAHCHLGIGTGHGRANRGEQAREHLAKAAGLYRSLEMPFWMREAEGALQRFQDLPAS
jgi:class 3 adenylate cyclase/tetratricopeptide (TPR) repeat protein